VFLRTSYVTWVNHAALWGPLALWLPFLAVYQNTWGFAKMEGSGADYKVSRAGVCVDCQVSKYPAPRCEQCVGSFWLQLWWIDYHSWAVCSSCLPLLANSACAATLTPRG
jgi:hypothetical protein